MLVIQLLNVYFTFSSLVSLTKTACVLVTKEYFTKKSIFIVRCNKYTHYKKVNNQRREGSSNMSFALSF